MRWKKDQVEFRSKLFRLSKEGTGSVSRAVIVPKPIVTLFGDPSHVKFTITKDGVLITKA